MYSNSFQRELAGRATGSTVTGLRQPELLKCHLMIPSRETQDKIANILSNLDKKIDLNNQIIINLQQLINDIFIHKFVKGYPTNINIIVSEQGYGANPYIPTTKKLIHI